MKRQIILVVILASYAFSNTSSQEVSSEVQRLFDEFNELQVIYPKDNSMYNGSPYQQDLFYPGTITLKNGTSFDKIALRYNVYNDQFEFDKDGKQMAISNPQGIAMISLNHQSFIFDTYISESGSKRGYLEKVIEGPYTLYIKHRVLLRKGEESGAYQAATNPTFVGQKPDHFISFEGSEIIRIKNTDDLLNSIPGIESAIKKYTGKKKLKLKKDEDFINLVTYLNTQ